MGPITLALEFVHARKWLVELILAAIIVGAVWYWHHSAVQTGVAKGVAAQKHEDELAAEQLHIQVETLTEQNRALARAAEARYDTEHTANVAGAAVPVGTSQLCNPTRHAHESGGGLPAAGGGDRGNAAAAAGPNLGAGLPAPDNELAEDREALLGAFAALFDDKTALIRQYQGRRPRLGVALDPRLESPVERPGRYAAGLRPLAAFEVGRDLVPGLDPLDH